MTERIVQVTSLAEFMSEVPTPLHVAGADEPNRVRLSCSELRGSSKGRMSIPYKTIELLLQGVNAQNEIVCLMWNYIFDFPDDEFMNRKGYSLYKLMPDVEDMVGAWLISHGYSVRGGRYAMPKSLMPLRGHFECVRFVSGGDEEGYRLESVE